MEKNIAALMREDTRTVHVAFDARETDIGVAIAQQVEAAVRAGHVASGGFAGMPKAPDAKLWTYVTDIDLKVGDCVVVSAENRLKIASVRKVDDNVSIEPNSEIKFGWVISKIDMAPALANEERNKEIETAVNEAYKANLRRGFANTVLAGLDDASRGKIAALLGNSKASA